MKKYSVILLVVVLSLVGCKCGGPEPEVNLPSTPVVSIAQDGTDVVVTWIGDADYYKFWKDGVLLDGALYANQYRDSDVSVGTNYVYEVAGVNADGTGAKGTAAITVLDLEVPDAPENFVVGNNNDTEGAEYVAGTWDAVDGASGYLVEKGDDGVNFGTTYTLDATQLTFVDFDLNPGETWYYRVSAFNNNGTSAPTSVLSCYVEPAENPEATVFLEMIAQDGRTVRQVLEDEGFDVNFGTSPANIEGVYDAESSGIDFEVEFSNQSGIEVDYTRIVYGTTAIRPDSLITGISNNKFTLWYSQSGSGYQYIYIRSGSISIDGTISISLITITIYAGSIQEPSIKTEVYIPQS